MGMTGNNLTKDPKKVASLDATIKCNQTQWKITTSTAVATTATACSKTTNPALPLTSTGSEITSHKTHVHNKPANPSALPSLSVSNSSIPYMTEGFDEGHLHHALPICGLPLEEKPHINNTRQVKQVMQSNHQCKEHSTVTQGSEAVSTEKGQEPDPKLPCTVN